MTKIFTKTINNIVYTKTVTEKIGRNDVVLSYQIEYSPAIKFGNENDNWIEK